MEEQSKIQDEKAQVKSFWEGFPCELQYAPQLARGTLELYETLERERYDVQAPFLHSFIQFTRQHSKRVLEIGVGVGTDFTQTVRAGAIAVGIDLTRAATELTRDRLHLYGLKADLIVADAENLPFRVDAFDFIYSIGVIHHSPSPQAIIDEVFRVLVPKGKIRIAMYNRYAGAVYRYYLKYALLHGKPFKSLSSVLSEYIESKGTKAYTGSQLAAMFSSFEDLRLKRVVLDGERNTFRRVSRSAFLARHLPNRFASFWFIEGEKRHRSQ